MFFLIAQQSGETGAGSSSGSGFGDSLAEIGLNPFQTIVQDVRRLDILNHPQELLEALQQLHIVWAGIFITVGLMAVLNGHRWHRWIVMITAFVSGMALGHWLGGQMESSVIIAACSGVLAAIIAWPLMKFAITACGGLAGAFVGANAWTALSLPPDTHYAGALIGLIAFGLLSFILHRMVIVAMTCIAGSLVVVMGGITVMLHVDAWRDAVHRSFESNTLVLPLVVLVLAVLGFVVQQTTLMEQQNNSRAKPAMA